MGYWIGGVLIFCTWMVILSTRLGRIARAIERGNELTQGDRRA